MALDAPSVPAEPQSEFAKAALGAAPATSADADEELRKAIAASMDSSQDAKPEDNVDDELQKAIEVDICARCDDTPYFHVGM